MGLGIDLTLLAIDAEPGHLRVAPTLPYSLVVGELVDLAVAGRITVSGDVIEVLDRSPVGDALADDSLARLADLRDGVSVEQWLERQGRRRVEACLNGLRHQNVLRQSSNKVVGSGRIEIADTLRAAAPVDRLRRLIAEDGDQLSVQDLAFAALADSTGWPQARLRFPAHRDHRARLKRLTAAAAGSADTAGYEGDAAFAVLRLGMQATAKLARQSLGSGEHDADHDSGSSRSREHGNPMSGRGLRLVADIVALLALATLVLACLENIALAIVIAPFTLVLVGLPVVIHVGRRDDRRKAVRPVGDEANGV